MIMRRSLSMVMLAALYGCTSTDTTPPTPDSQSQIEGAIRVDENKAYIKGVPDRSEWIGVLRDNGNIYIGPRRPTKDTDPLTGSDNDS